MDKLQAEDLYTLESYTKLREDYRARVMEHKKHRRLLLGDNVLLLFEDRLTIQYQIQEMLRVERIFEEVSAFSGGKPAHDDQTVLVVQWRKESDNE